MKNHRYMKSLYWSFFVGLGISATATHVQAADIGMAVLTDSHAYSQPKSSTESSRKTAIAVKGAQGPIRTETFSDQKPKVDSEMVRRDLEAQRYPMANNVGIP
ncbi:MAG TPA: hypothetical protein VF096_13340 [Azonexus sp.]